MEELMNLEFTNAIWAFICPGILMLLDVITGYYNAWKNNEVSSAKMRDGLGKKCAELCWIVVGILFKYAFGATAIMYAIILYICFMELVSLGENAKKLGFPMPENWLRKFNNTNKGE